MVWWRVRARNALMVVIGFLWGALRFLLQVRASLAGNASEPAGQAQPEERGGEGGAAGLEARRARAGGGSRPKGSTKGGRKVGRKRRRKKKKREKRKRKGQKGKKK
jgi:hypothetical protein